MRKRTFQLAAILLAFIIGVAINYSCGDNYQSDDVSVSYLWNEVKAMQDEIKQLKAEISNLKNGGGSSGEFQVDGLWFSRNGVCDGMIKETSTQHYLNGAVNISYTYKYEYDNYGRGIKLTLITNTNGTTTQQESKYQYNGKTVTVTTYDMDGTIANKSTATYYN